MSYDLSMSKGDLVIGSDGDLGTIQQSSKLVQDVLKVFHTPVGSDPFFPQKGSNITTQNIGMVVNAQFVQARTNVSVLNTLQQIQAIQKQQSTYQTLDPAETIKDIGTVTAMIDPNEPRQFNISITVITGAITTVAIPTFSLSTTI